MGWGDKHMMKRNQFGKFSIPKLFIDNNPELVMQICQNMIIVRAENMFDTDKIEYVAISGLFEEVPTGHSTPSYNLIIEKIAGNTVVRAEKI